MNHIGLELKQMRQQLKLTLRGAAKLSGVAKSTINNIELGKVDCGYKKLEKLQASYKEELTKQEKK